jgi:hypothetical protein
MENERKMREKTAGYMVGSRLTLKFLDYKSSKTVLNVESFMQTE